MRTCVRWAFIISSLFFLAVPVRSQSLGNAGTVDGSVVDQCGAAIPKAEIQIHNPVSGYPQSTIAANDGSFHLVNIPPNQYHLEIKASGFSGFNGIPSQENDDHKPDRVTPRHVFNLAPITCSTPKVHGGSSHLSRSRTSRIPSLCTIFCRRLAARISFSRER